ncbi:uracil-DNA glycosylase family protein [Paludisphaera sp.]|uniref:uracil-DNA glycosylase family protein n=1 Tax=Paludisphaera sp. TaxID=2017432 RepID=UPI00301C7CEF
MAEIDAETATDPYAEELARLARQARGRLESLARAGAVALPKSPELPAVSRPSPAIAPHDAEPAAEPPSVERPRPAPVASPVVERPRPAPPAVERPRPAAPPTPPRPIAAPSLFGSTGFSTPPLDPAERPAALAVLREEVAGCVRCPDLAASRTQTVFADGAATARLMFIGEAPGADEDRAGVPFVGKAGQLLTDMITKGMGLRREDVFIANILKCRPPDNRDPMPAEVANCVGYLDRQIEIVRPEFICLLGKVAAGTLLNTALSMGRLRGRWHRVHGIPTVATYHPAYLLRTPAAKKEAWEDLQMLMRAMGLVIPRKKA